MQLMTNPMTAVEALQLYCGYAQVAKHLKLPCQAYMALSDSKFNDPQSGMETGVGAFLAAAVGFNSVSGPGMLDYVNCFSLEKLVFDDEVVAHAQRFVRPVAVREDLPTAELLAELVREKHLLTSEHTLAHWPDVCRRAHAAGQRGGAARGEAPRRDPGPLPTHLQGRGSVHPSRLHGDGECLTTRS